MAVGPPHTADKENPVDTKLIFGYTRKIDDIFSCYILVSMP